MGSVKGGGKAAHAFSRRTLSSPTSLLNESGHPVCGQEALSFLLQVWTPLWIAAGRGAITRRLGRSHPRSPSCRPSRLTSFEGHVRGMPGGVVWGGMVSIRVGFLI